MGRLFDTAAALLGFTREVAFEGQAAMWLERLASRSSTTDSYLFPFSGRELDFRSVLDGIIRDRLRGRDNSEIARAFQRGIADGVRDAVTTLCRQQGLDTVVLSGGVFRMNCFCATSRAFWNLNVCGSGQITSSRPTMAESASGKLRWPRWQALGQALPSKKPILHG
jgi:hydrogenase maturation protein HypF